MKISNMSCYKMLMKMTAEEKKNNNIININRNRNFFPLMDTAKEFLILTFKKLEKMKKRAINCYSFSFCVNIYLNCNSDSILISFHKYDLQFFSFFNYCLSLSSLSIIVNHSKQRTIVSFFSSHARWNPLILSLSLSHYHLYLFNSFNKYTEI